MIPSSQPTLQHKTWQSILAGSIRQPEELFQLLALDTSLPELARFADKQFPLQVTRSFVERMRKGDINDPLLRQVLPVAEEMQAMPGYVSDPLQERAYNPLPGLLHKYHGRVLLLLTAGCAINCRYCFRRHFDYRQNQLSDAHWQQILQYIQADKTIQEVIFSGGDPLLISDKRLHQYLTELEQISHLQRLRIHSRMPIVLPERINYALLTSLARSRLRSIMVIHCNHANEIDANVSDALQQLRTTGTMLLNQSVLLQGVNDNVDTLVALSHALFAMHCQPYYLHLLDKVQGSAHFAVTETKAKQLVRQLQQRLPGYLVPKLVREDAGSASKILVSLE